MLLHCVIDSFACHVCSFAVVCSSVIVLSFRCVAVYGIGRCSVVVLLVLLWCCFVYSYDVVVLMFYLC